MTGRQLPGAQYEGATLEQMRGWIDGGAGKGALVSNAEAWRAEQQYMAALAEEVKAKMAKAGVAIQGRSGEAMQGAVAPLALWTEIAADNASAQSSQADEQVNAFERVRSSIPAKSEEVPVPEENFFGRTWADFTGGKTDNEEAKAQNEALRQEAVRAFTGYHSASESTVGGSAVFTEPPKVGQQVAVSSQQVTSVTPQTSTVSPTSGSPANSGSAWAGSGAGTGSMTGTIPGGSTGAPPPSGSGSAWAPTPTPGGPGSTGRDTGTPPGRGPSTGVPGPLAPGQGRETPPGQRGPGVGRQAPPGQRGPGTGTGTGRGAPGSGVGRGSGIGSGQGAGQGAGRGALGPGGQSGVGGSSRGVAGPAGGSSGARPGMGAGMAGGAAGAGGRGQQGDEDQEHELPDYLRDDYGYFDDDMPIVAPPVFGDSSREED